VIGSSLGWVTHADESSCHIGPRRCQSKVLANAAVSGDVASQEVIGDEVTREKRQRMLLGSVPLREMHVGAKKPPSLERDRPGWAGAERGYPLQPFHPCTLSALYRRDVGKE
jgi:hypothetical protein